MENKLKFTEKIVRANNKKIKRDADRFLRIFLIVFIFGYLFFFSSTLWMPTDYTGVKASVIGKDIEGNDREVALSAWDFCEDQEMFEIVLEITNLSTDGINRYKWSVIDKTNGMMKVKPVIETDDLVVLHVQTNSFTEVSLRMDSPADDEDFETLRFYTTKKDVNRVGHIEKKDEAAYRKIALDARIGYAEKCISSAKKEIEKQEEIIKNADKTISDLKEKQKFQTEEEKLDTDDKIAEIDTERQTAAEAIEDKQEEIKEQEKRIKMLKERKK